MKLLSRNVAISTVLLGSSLCLVSAGADEAPIKIAIPSNSITGFCMGLRLARDPEIPGAATRDPAPSEDILLSIPQFPTVVNSNDVNIGECSGISTIVNAWNKGAKDFVAIGFGSKLPVYQLVAAPGIKTLPDLEGKNVGIPGIQSAGAEAAQMILSRGAGMKPGENYNFVSVGAGPGGLAALEAQRISAMPYFPPLSFDLIDKGFPVLADEAKFIPQYVTGVHIVNREWANQHRKLVVALIKNMIRTTDWIGNPANEQAVVTWFSQHWAPTAGQFMSKDHAQRTYDFYIKDGRLSLDGYAPEEAVRANIKILIERGYLKVSETPPLGELFDFSYLNDALKELGRPTVAEYKK
jgi:ABC-type nitrate/sulfonate/bicarbonate transport system substrate-binding protein